MYIIRDKECGNEIEHCETLKQAETVLKEFEETDKKDGTYTPDFYEIIKLNYYYLVARFDSFSQSATYHLMPVKPIIQGEILLRSLHAESLEAACQILESTTPYHRQPGTSTFYLKEN